MTLNEITVNLYFQYTLTDYGLWPDVQADMTGHTSGYDRSYRQIRPVMQADKAGFKEQHDRLSLWARPVVLQIIVCSVVFGSSPLALGQVEGDGGCLLQRLEEEGVVLRIFLHQSCDGENIADGSEQDGIFHNA